MEHTHNPWIVAVVSIVVILALEFRDWYRTHYH